MTFERDYVHIHMTLQASVEPCMFDYVWPCVILYDSAKINLYDFFDSVWICVDLYDTKDKNQKDQVVTTSKPSKPLLT